MQALLEQYEDYIDIDVFSEEFYSLDKSIEKSKETLKSLEEEDVLWRGDFEDEIWELENNNRKGNSVLLIFSSEKCLKIDHKNYDENVNIVKCWVANLLEYNFPSSVQRNLQHIKFWIDLTDFFNINHLDKMLEYFEVTEDSKYVVYNKINAALNFITYCDNESAAFSMYKEKLLQMKFIYKDDQIKTREIPKAKDILTFSKCIDSFFESDISDNLEKLFFAAILLWWRITNVIPMRINEFINIKRNCIGCEDGRYYIALPRSKKPATQRRVQVPDTFEITKEIYNLIESYIKSTERYGISETLISYRSVDEIGFLLHGKSNNARGNKKLKNVFSFNSFHRLLARFYKDVVYQTYNESVEREVKPNDTRHLAICSLMMQGISPIEIARLAGHSTIEAQYHYSNHTEYFIDSEVYKLIQKYRRNENGTFSSTFNDSDISWQEIKKKSRLFPTSDIRYPVEVGGYCTDKEQRCESEECLLCSHWWIHPKELQKLRPVIEEKIYACKQRIMEIGDFLSHLRHNFPQSDDIHPNIEIKMKTETASVYEHLHQIAHLELLKGDE